MDGQIHSHAETSVTIPVVFTGTQSNHKLVLELRGDCEHWCSLMRVITALVSGPISF